MEWVESLALSPHGHLLAAGYQDRKQPNGEPDRSYPVY
jgi:hypothetical protein